MPISLKKSNHHVVNERRGILRGCRVRIETLFKVGIVLFVIFQIGLLRVSQHVLPSTQPRKQIHHDPLEIKKPYPLPPVKDVLSKPSWLLDYAIVGWPKCGTTTMMKMLNTPDSYTIPREICMDNIDDKIRLLHKEHPRIPDKKLGIKCPTDIIFHPDHYVHPFHQTKLIIGIRHPILWFESFYNYRIRQDGKVMPPTDELIHCPPGIMDACSELARFHFFLSKLRKTPLKEEELHLLKMTKRALPPTRHYGKVFIYDLEQISDTNATRRQIFQDDLRGYLDIGHEISIKEIDAAKKGMKNEKFSDRLIDICDPEHDKIRKILLAHGKTGSVWIQEYFLKSHQVTVSSISYLKEILDQWKIDPCIERKKGKT